MIEHQRHRGYWITEDGRVYSEKSQRYLSVFSMNSRKKDWYRVVNFNKKRELVHRLVAEIYLPNPHNYSEVNHINGDKTDNTVSNLEWCSRKQNVSHQVTAGLHRNVCFLVRNMETGEEFITKNLRETAELYQMTYKQLYNTQRCLTTNFPLLVVKKV